MDPQALFGRNVERLRLGRDLSRADLADRAGMTARYIGRLEKGEGRPTLKTLEALALGLDVEPHLLLQEIDGRAPENSPGR